MKICGDSLRRFYRISRGLKPWSFSKAYAALEGPLFHVTANCYAALEGPLFHVTANCCEVFTEGTARRHVKSDLPLGWGHRFDGLDFYCGIDESQGGAAEGFVFAEDQG